MNTLELKIVLPESLQDILIAYLDDLGFEGFVQEEALLKAYVTEENWSPAQRAALRAWLDSKGCTSAVEEQVFAPQNWNARWEDSITPIAVGRFLIKPTWATVPEDQRDQIVLEIDPKMSFGTGYHESTRLILRSLPDLVQPGDQVLDAGTGTGILAIAALKLGATKALAFDVDEWVAENALENFDLNGVAAQVEYRTGSLDVVPEAGFDLVLANINRNVLLAFLPGLAAKVHPGGRVVLAGLLNSDRAMMLAAAAKEHLKPIHEATEGDWWSVAFVKE